MALDTLVNMYECTRLELCSQHASVQLSNAKELDSQSVEDTVRSRQWYGPILGVMEAVLRVRSLHTTLCLVTPLHKLLLTLYSGCFARWL